MNAVPPDRAAATVKLFHVRKTKYEPFSPAIRAQGFIHVNLTSPIRPAVPEFSSGKSLSSKGCRGPERRKSAVVPTKSILQGGHEIDDGWPGRDLPGVNGEPLHLGFD
jgi:hypothetical protein